MEILDEFDIDYRDSGKNVQKGEINICCPFCGEGKYHCSINLNKNKFYCRSCGYGGNLIFLLHEITGINKLKLKSLLRNNTIEEKEIRIEKKGKLSLPPYTYSLKNTEVDGFSKSASAYLKERGFNRDTIVNNDLYYCKFGDYAYRIIIPIYKDNILVNYLGRDWTGLQKIKYMNCPNDKAIIRRSELIYTNRKKNEYKNRVIVVEGVTDYWNVDYSIATLGKAISDQQLNLILELNSNEIIFMLDPDAIYEAKKSLRELTLFHDNVKISRLSNADPADMKEEEIDSYIESAKKFSRYF